MVPRPAAARRGGGGRRPRAELLDRSRPGERGAEVALGVRRRPDQLGRRLPAPGPWPRGRALSRGGGADILGPNPTTQEAFMASCAITDVAIVLKPEDDVAIAKKEIPAGTVLEDAGGRIEVRQDIKPGHKVARRARRTGEVERRYG